MSSWIGDRENWLGRRRHAVRHGVALRKEPVYTVSEVAAMFRVDKRTVFKWLAVGEPEEAIIHPDDWFKLRSSGHIRIYERAVIKLQNEGA